MKKDNFYFSHDYTAARDPKIIKLINKFGWEGYGMFWHIIEVLHEQAGKLFADDFLDILMYELNIKEDKLNEFVAFLIKVQLLSFFEDEQFYSSNRVLKNLEFKEIKRDKLSENGKKGGRPRKEENKPIEKQMESKQKPIAFENESKKNHIKLNKIKLKEIKLNKNNEEELNLAQKNFLSDTEIENSSSENLDFLEKEISSNEKLQFPEIEIEFSFYENEIEQFKNDFSFSEQEILDLIKKSKQTVKTQNRKFDSRAELMKYMTTKFQLAQDRIDKKLHQDSFDEWWVIYEKKTEKAKALKLWEKIKPELVPEILAHTAEYVKSTPVKKFRKSPDTYLRNESWNDEIIYDKSIKSNQNQGVNQNGTSLGINQKYPNLQIRSVADLRATLTVADLEASRKHLRETGY